MDLYEKNREIVADIVSAWRAAGYEPESVYINGTSVMVAVKAADYSSVSVHRFRDQWFLSDSGTENGEYPTLADTVAAGVAVLAARAVK